MYAHDVELPPVSWLEERIERIPPDSCWHWVSTVARDGYGHAMYRKKNFLAHRLVYTVLVGQIPEGLTLDHLCRVRSCVNPAHLEPVTQRVNWSRGTSPSLKRSQQTHCIYGHPLSGDNIYRITNRFGNPVRYCVICTKARARRDYERENPGAKANPWGKRKVNRV